MARDVGNIPNEGTKKAIEVARNGIELESMDDIDGFFESLRNELTKNIEEPKTITLIRIGTHSDLFK